MHGFMMIAALATLPAAVPDRQDPNLKDARPFEQQLLGEWRLVKRVNSGRDDPNVAIMRMIFSKDNMQQYSSETNTGASTFPFTLDAARSPVTITFKTGQTGLIKIEGNLLTICLNNAGGSFPTEFMSLPNTQLTILQLTRTKR